MTTCACSCSLHWLVNSRFQHHWGFQLSAPGRRVWYHLYFDFITQCTCSVRLMQTFHTQKLNCKLYRCITMMLYLLLIGTDFQRLKGTTLLFSYKKFVRFCLLTYSPYQLIETVKRVSLRVLVTQSYPDACQHCHVI